MSLSRPLFIGAIGGAIGAGFAINYGDTVGAAAIFFVVNARFGGTIEGHAFEVLGGDFIGDLKNAAVFAD